MWETLININPNFIANYHGYNKKIYWLALKNGYKVKEKDLIKNKNLCSNLEIMKEAIKENPQLIKYCKVTDYDVIYLIEQAMNASNGYIPNIKDLEYNNNLGRSSELINNLEKYGCEVRIYFDEICFDRENKKMTLTSKDFEPYYIKN